MKFHHVLFAVSLGAIGTTSFADHPFNAEEGFNGHPQIPSGAVTRGDVRTSVMGAQRDGSLYWIGDYPAAGPLVQGSKLSNSRDQIKAELRAWQKNPVTPDGIRFIPGEVGWTEAR